MSRSCGRSSIGKRRSNTRGPNSRCRSMVRAIGEGKALKSILHPAGRVEIWIAPGGPMNTALAAEVADGWLPMGYGSDGWSIHGANLEQGWARRGGRPDTSRSWATSPSRSPTTSRRRSTRRSPHRHVCGGMGSEDNNFHRDAMARRGGPRPQLGFKNSGSRAAKTRRSPPSRRLHRCRCPLRSGVEDRPTLG